MTTVLDTPEAVLEEGLRRLATLPPGMLACPDTGAAVVADETGLHCPESGRHFDPVEGVPALLPQDFVFSKELQFEDAFYQVESPEQTFPKAHHLAHGYAREPIAAACEALGVGAEDWVLNVGAGAGSKDLGYLSRYTQRIVCADISPTAGKLFLAREPFPCLLATLEQLPFAENTFDAVVVSGVIHHVAGYGKMNPYLDAVYRVLKPGKPFICVEPNLLYPTAGPMALIDVVGQRVRPGWRHHVPHERPLVPSRLLNGMRAAGFDTVELWGTSYIHNKFPWPLVKALDTLTPLAKKPFFRHFGYWIGATGIKPGART